MESYLTEAPFLYFSSLDDGKIVEVNQALCRELGFERIELIGSNPELFFTLSTRIFQQTHLFPLLKMQGQAAEIYLTLKTKTGDHLPVLINAERKQIGDQLVTFYAGIAVHNRKKFEDELVAAKRAAETALNQNTALLQAKQELQRHVELLDQQMLLASRQNEELRQFSRIVTHDLQEPLRKLFVFTNMLLEASDAAIIAKSVQKIRSVSEQMRSLLSGLQQYIWLDETPVKNAPVDLHRLLGVAKSQLETDHPGIAIRIQTDAALRLHGDAQQLAFLLHELLRNAVRFRKKPDEISVRISATELQQNQFTSVVGKYHYRPFVKLQITDDGTGFDPAYKAQVFELFKRLHPESGAGIGLSLCKKIVENHQGNITIDSRMGEGTTVSILLPHPNKEEPVVETNATA